MSQLVSSTMQQPVLSARTAAVRAAGPSRHHHAAVFANPVQRAFVATGRSAGLRSARGHTGSSCSYRRKVTVCGLFGLGVPELAVIAGVAALIWGPSKLPELGKGLGKAVKGFQSAATEFNDELKKATAEESAKDAAEATKKEGTTSSTEAAAAPKKE